MSTERGSSRSETELELYFLISKFLENGPCQNTFKAFQQEMAVLGLLPTTFDSNGVERSQTIADLSKKHPNVNENTLIEICKRLRDLRGACVQTGLLRVSSLLCSGRYSLLRSDASRPKLPFDRIAARKRGYPIPDPAGYMLVTNVVRTLEARRISGGLTRKALIWPKMYNRIQLLNQTLGHLSGVYCVLFDHSGQFIFTGADDLLVKVWSTVSGRLLATFRGASSEITDLAVNPENTLLAAGSLDRVCYVWCLQTTALVAQLTGNVGMITAVNFCPKTCHDMRYLASTGTYGSVAFWMYYHERIGKDTLFNMEPIVFNEKMRPGVAQMICSSFSPGGVFLAAGSADHHVRVYLITSVEGPQRIMEEEAHSDCVDSIQWANRGLRFVSGSKDGTALIWRFSHQKWNFFKLDITVSLPGNENQETSEDQYRQKPRVSMVCWDKSDKWIVAAGRDAALKVWNSETGELIKVLRNHRHDVFVLEPHPLDEGILLSAGHDGLLCIWDIRTGACLLQYQNLVEHRGNGLFYDAKWSPDGTLIAATDSHGHVLLFGFGAARQAFKELPKQLFFNTDYWPLIRDSTRGLLDSTTGEPPHLMAAPFLVDVDGTPYPLKYQSLVPGREFQDSFSMAIPQIAAQDANLNGEYQIGAAFYPSAELASSRGSNTPNAWQSRMLLPQLKSSIIKQIVDIIEAKAKFEETEYNSERKRPAVTPQRPATVNVKVRKKRAPATYKTRAAAATEDSQFVNPESVISHSSNSDSDVSSSSADIPLSDSSCSTVYSDWLADHGVSLEPPIRTRRRRPPNRLSPSPTTTRTRAKESERLVTENAESSTDEEQDPLKPEKIKEVPAEYMPPKWLSEVMPRKAPYYPQMGDHVMFFKEGYKIYLDVVRKKQVYKPSTRDSFSKLNLEDPIHVQVIGIKYEIRPPRLCCLRLATIDSDGSMTDQFFNIKYHDVPDVIDFLVLKQTYDIAMSRHWEPGDRFRCVIDDSWWLGIIVATRSDKMYENSPFLSLATKWDNGEEEPMSPWDMEPVDPNRMPPEPGGSIDLLPEEAQSLLYTPGADEWPDGRGEACDRILAGLELVMSLSVAEPFSAPVDLNLYPSYAMYVEYPVDLSTIKARLENRFYRRLTGVQFDVRYLAKNAEKFNDAHSQIVKQARIVADLCLRIIKNVRDKTEMDVMKMYHSLMDGYHSSSDDDNKEDENEHKAGEEGILLRSSLNLALEHVNWRGDCERLLRELTSLPDSSPFRQPVDLLELPDYLQDSHLHQTIDIKKTNPTIPKSQFIKKLSWSLSPVVTTPMDLATVREELMAGNFMSPKDFYEAVNLIFNNSRKYNTNKRSRIHGMAARLSNLFEARIKKLEHEWKTSHRKRIQKATQRGKLLGPRPGPSHRSPSSPDNAVDPLRSSDEEIKDNLPTEPQPSTSRQPGTLSRRWSSDSDEDAYLSTLRFNLKQSSMDDDTTRNNDDADSAASQDVPLANSRVSDSSTDADENRLLSTLQCSAEPNDIQVNGHSYTILKADNSDKVKIIKISQNNVNTEGDSTIHQPLVGNTVENHESELANGPVNGNVSSEESDDAASSWNDENEDAHEVDEASDTATPSTDSESTDVSYYKKPGRRKSRRTTTRRHAAVGRSRNSRQQSSGSDESFFDGSRVISTSESSNQSSDSEIYKPRRTRRRRRRLKESGSGRPKTRNRRALRKKSESESDEDEDPPKSRNRRRVKRSDSDEDSPHRKSKRRRKNSSESESSTWKPSDSESDQKKRKRGPRRGNRTSRAVSDEDDDEGDGNEVPTAISSRGRVRKFTEKAKAAFGRRHK